VKVRIGLDLKDGRIRAGHGCAGVVPREHKPATQTQERPRACWCRLPPYAGKATRRRLRTEGAQAQRRTVTLGGAIAEYTPGAAA